jgi:hypothetical protein
MIRNKIAEIWRAHKYYNLDVNNTHSVQITIHVYDLFCLNNSSLCNDCNVHAVPPRVWCILEHEAKRNISRVAKLRVAIVASTTPSLTYNIHCEQKIRGVRFILQLAYLRLQTRLLEVTKQSADLMFNTKA